MQGIRAAGGTPIEVNTISITDGITMGTEGMKGSLVSREVVADSVELVARSHMFDGLVTISGCDKTIPAMTMVLGRVNIPSPDALLRLHHVRPLRGIHRPLRRAQPDHPGRLRGDRRLQRGQDLAGAVQGRRGPRLPGRGRLRRPVHRQHHGHRLRDAGHVAHGLERRPRHRPAKGRGGLRVGQAGHGAAAQGDDARARWSRARASRTRSPASWRPAAPPTRCSTSSPPRKDFGRQAVHRRLRPHLEADAACWPTSSPGATTPRPRCTRRAACRWWASACSRPACCTRASRRSPGARIGDEVKNAAEPAGQKVIRPLTEAIKPTGGIAILRGNIAPGGCVIKLSGQTKYLHRGPARVFERRGGGVHRRSRRARSSPTTSSSSATKGRRAGPACGRCSTCRARCRARGSATRWRS